MSEGQPRGIGGVARRLSARVKSVVAPEEVERPGPRGPAATPGATRPTEAPVGPKKGLFAKAAANRKEAQAAQAELDALTRERDELRQQRLGIQQTLGATIGKSVMPRLKVEKTNGTPSFIVSTRMMQRIYAQGTDPTAGLDGVGAVFADPASAAAYAASHAVPVLAEGSSDEPTVIVHALKGRTPLVEVHGPAGVRHFEADGTDPGDIRPAVTYDAQIASPEGLEDICTWSRTLSRFIPRPYVQIHWSPTAEGPRLHHIDVDPDRIPVLTPEWDKKLGLVFDGAYTRYLKQPFVRGGLANRVPGGTFTPEEHA